jgi:hypothetical protein
MAQPTFRRFWIRVIPDGSAIPQFDPHTGKYCGYEAYEGPVAQVLFYPISPRLAELIRSQGDQSEASDIKPIVFDIPPSERADMHREGTLRLDPKHICGFCEAEFGPELGVCPRCLASNQWYCGKCDALKENPIVELDIRDRADQHRPMRIPYALLGWASDLVRQIPGRWAIKSAQIRCPDCEATEPRGLRPIRRIGEFCEERHFTHYVLRIGAERHIILDYKSRH